MAVNFKGFLSSLGSKLEIVLLQNMSNSPGSIVREGYFETQTSTSPTSNMDENDEQGKITFSK